VNRTHDYLVVLLLQQHDAVLHEQHMQFHRLAAARVAQLEGQRPVVDEAVLRQVQVLKSERRVYVLTPNCKLQNAKL
jgi:hypothetical protein